MNANLSRRTKPRWFRTSRFCNCLFRKIQRSPRPRRETDSPPESWQAKIIAACRIRATAIHDEK